MPEADWKNLRTLFPCAALHPAAIARAGEAVAAQPQRSWCVAFSGGADSLALLLTIRDLWPERCGKFVALHFNHRLRGAESEADAAFCREVCAALDVTLREGEWSEARVGASEAEARAARLAFFEKEMAAAGATVLWTGHQKDDIAETLLMRIARGSSSAGLAAPRPAQLLADGRVFLRPLLTLTKAEIIGALREVGAVWREDASNASSDFFRNRVRHDVVPTWREAAENDALSGAALTRELLEEDDAALAAWLDELLPEIEYTRDALDVRALAGRPRALWRRALRRWQPLATLARAGFGEVLALCKRGAGRVSAGDGMVELMEGVLRYVPTERAMSTAAWGEAALCEGVTLFLPDGATLTARRIALDEELRAKIFAGRVDPSHEAFIVTAETMLHVRTWRAGDRFRPLGAPGSAKLQDLFVNRKIPAGRRATLPVVTDELDRIRWIPGFPPAEESKITDVNVTAVRLTYETGTYTVHL